MHDDRVHVERRITRMLAERLRPSVYRDPVPLLLESWQAPGEPVPVGEGLSAQYSETKAGELWGPPWGTTWFHVTGTVPERWAGREVEAVVDLGFAPDRPGFSAEALAMRPDGTPVKALNPMSTWLPVAAAARGGEAVDAVRRGRLQPGHRRRRRRVVPRGRAHRRERAPLPRTARGARRVRAPGVGARAGHRGARPADARSCPPTRPAAGRSCARWSAALDALDLTDVAGTARRGPRRARRGAGRARARRRPPCQRRRPRAHRLGVAVAAARDRPQGRPHVRQRHRADGRPPRAASSRCPRPSSTPG